MAECTELTTPRIPNYGPWSTTVEVGAGDVTVSWHTWDQHEEGSTSRQEQAQTEQFSINGQLTTDVPDDNWRGDAYGEFHFDDWAGGPMQVQWVTGSLTLHAEFCVAPPPTTTTSTTTTTTTTSVAPTVTEQSVPSTTTAATTTTAAATTTTEGAVAPPVPSTTAATTTSSVLAATTVATTVQVNPPNTLPATGGSPAELLSGGMGFLFVGAVALVLARTRRWRHS